MPEEDASKLEVLKKALEQSQIAYDVLLSSQTGYIRRLREEIRRLRAALAAAQQNQSP